MLQHRETDEASFFPERRVASVWCRRCCRVKSRRAMQMLPALLALLTVCVRAQLSDDLSREQLKPLTAYRQQHRRLVCPSRGLRCCFECSVVIHAQEDGRLCAAAFVQERACVLLVLRRFGDPPAFFSRGLPCESCAKWSALRACGVDRRPS